MTVPLILLAIMSVCVAWPLPDSSGVPPLLDAEKSGLGQALHHYSQPVSTSAHVLIDFEAETKAAHEGHGMVGIMAAGVVVVGLVFALLLYGNPAWARGIFPPIFGALDPAEAKEQFAGVHRFLSHKWYFDEVYSALLVRPAVVVAHWCRNFDTYVIDGFVHLLQKFSMWTSTWSGKFDRGIIDGLVNVMADVSYAIGTRLRNMQTGYLRSYVLFLALAAVGLWMLLYALAQAMGRG
jgi:NADH-quinone oxidoreductase subunit L